MSRFFSGETAFPGRGGEVYSLRNKRLYRQFRPKQDWFDFEEESFDFTRPDIGMPWDPEVAVRMDRYPTKKYNLKSKMFRESWTEQVFVSYVVYIFCAFKGMQSWRLV